MIDTWSFPYGAKAIVTRDMATSDSKEKLLQIKGLHRNGVIRSGNRHGKKFINVTALKLAWEKFSVKNVYSLPRYCAIYPDIAH